MVNPSNAAEVARLQHEDNLRQAEAVQFYQELKKGQPGWFQQLRNQLNATRSNK